MNWTTLDYIVSLCNEKHTMKQIMKYLVCEDWTFTLINLVKNLKYFHNFINMLMLYADCCDKSIYNKKKYMIPF